MLKEVLITHYPHIIPPIKPYLQSICPNPSNYINHHQPHNQTHLPFRPILGWPCHRWLHGPPPCCTAVGPELHSSAAWHETNFHPSRCCRSPRRPSPGNPWQPGGVKPPERGFLQEWELRKPFWFGMTLSHCWEFRRLGKCFWFQHVGLCWMSLSWMTVWGLGWFWNASGIPAN